MKMFTVFDSKADVYSQPFYALIDHAAVRTFADAVNASESPYNKHPEDYCLFSIADFDDRTGIVTTYPPQHLGHAVNLLTEDPVPIRGNPTWQTNP